MTATLPVIVLRAVDTAAADHGTDRTAVLTDIVCFHYDRPDLMRHLPQQVLFETASATTELSDEEFVEFLYWRDNPKGVIFERWRHIHGCGRFFNAARDTVSDRFLLTYKAGEPKPDLSKLTQTNSVAAKESGK